MDFFSARRHKNSKCTVQLPVDRSESKRAPLWMGMFARLAQGRQDISMTRCLLYWNKYMRVLSMRAWCNNSRLCFTTVGYLSSCWAFVLCSVCSNYFPRCVIWSFSLSGPVFSVDPFVNVNGRYVGLRHIQPKTVIILTLTAILPRLAYYVHHTGSRRSPLCYILMFRSSYCE